MLTQEQFMQDLKECVLAQFSNFSQNNKKGIYMAPSCTEETRPKKTENKFLCSPNFHVTVDVCCIFRPHGDFVALHSNVHHSATDLVRLSVKRFANEAQHLHHHT